MSYYRAIIATFSCVLFSSYTTVFSGTVSDTYKYAWSDNVGYINFSNVIVESTRLSGFAWSKNNGWIKLDPAQSGVTHDGAGQLSGYAWGESLGWIDFSGVSIDISTGKFSGIATGDIVGTITFNCLQYCDVRTDWRPAQPENSSSGGSGGGSSLFTTSPVTSLKGAIATSIALIQKTFFQKNPVEYATRLETVLLALKFQKIPIFKNYSCSGFHTDTVGVMVPWFTCQVAEKARLASIISQTNLPFYPLRPVSRVEAYSIMMKGICVHPITSSENWQQKVIEKAIDLGFTVRTFDDFEPNRHLFESEMHILDKRFTEYAQKHNTCK